MSEKFIVEGGLNIPSGKQLELAGVSLSAVSNDATLAGDSQSDLVTEYAVKSYVDTYVAANNQWTLEAGTNGTGASNEIDSGETLTINGVANETDIVVAANAVTIGLPDDVTIGDALTVTGFANIGTSKLKINGTAVTATAAELNYLDDDDLTAADLTKLAAITASAAEINDLTGNAVDSSDFTKLSNVTASATELNYLDITTLGTSEDGKALTQKADGTHVYGATAGNETFDVASHDEVDGGLKLAGTLVTASAAELNYLDDDDLTAADLTKLAAITASAAEINDLTGNAVDADDLTKLSNITATAAEINDLTSNAIDADDMTKLSNVTATAAELNIMDADTVQATVTLEDSDGVVVSDGTVMKQCLMSDFEVYMESSLDTMGAQFTSAASLATIGTITTGEWNGTAIANGYLANSTTSVGGVTLTLGGTDATPAFLLTDATGYLGDSNLVTVGTITSGTWNGTAIANANLANSTMTVGGVTLTLGATDATPAFVLTDATGYLGDSNLVTSGALNSGSITSGFGNIDIGSSTLDAGATTLAGDLSIAGNKISGTADEMIISADGGEDSASGNAPNSLTLNASAGIFTDDAVDMDSTLNVEGVATFQAESVHSSGIDCNGAIDVSGASVLNGAVTLGDASSDDITVTGRVASSVDPKTDGTYEMGSSDRRWLKVHSDEVSMPNSSRKDFSVTADGTAKEMFTFEAADYQTVKVVSRVKDSGGDFTAKELLFVCKADGSSPVFTEYGTVSTGTEIDVTWTIVNSADDTMSVKCNSSSSNVVKGSYELIA
jgi:hypothetical protein